VVLKREVRVVRIGKTTNRRSEREKKNLRERIQENVDPIKRQTVRKGIRKNAEEHNNRGGQGSKEIKQGRANGLGGKIRPGESVGRSLRGKGRKVAGSEGVGVEKHNDVKRTNGNVKRGGCKQKLVKKGTPQKKQKQTINNSKKANHKPGLKRSKHASN